MGKNTASGSNKTFVQVLRRYWYWFATVPLLFAVSFVWLYFIGVFDSVNAIVIRSSTPETITMPVDTMYHMVVTSDSDLTPVYSSNHPSIVDVTQDGMLISHKEGSAVVTTAFGKKRYEVAVNVISYSTTWYLTSGDTFDRNDVFAAFPYATGMNNVSVTGDKEKSYLKYLNSVFNDKKGYMEYIVADDLPEEELQPIYLLVSKTAMNNKEASKDDQKGVITLYLVPTQEEKEEKIAAYQKNIFNDTEERMDVPADQVDEVIDGMCGTIYPLAPKLTKGGFVRFYVEGIPEDFPLHMDQTGNLSIDAMIKEFYVIAIVNNEEAYRYKCSATPQTAPLTLHVGEKMIIEEYVNFFPSNVVRFSTVSSKLEELYGDEGDFIGYLAKETTDNFVYIDCSSFEESNYITFRVEVRITDEDPQEGYDG